MAKKEIAIIAIKYDSETEELITQITGPEGLKLKMIEEVISELQDGIHKVLKKDPEAYFNDLEKLI